MIRKHKCWDEQCGVDEMHVCFKKAELTDARGSRLAV